MSNGENLDRPNNAFYLRQFTASSALQVNRNFVADGIDFKAYCCYYGRLLKRGARSSLKGAAVWQERDGFVWSTA